MVELKPIRTATGHKAALAEAAALMDAEAGTPEGDRLEVLALLIGDYEARHHRLGPPDPIEAIEFALEQKAMRQSDLAAILGSKSHTSEIMNRKRPLSLEHIRALHRALGIPLDVLVQEYPVERRAG